MFAMWKMQPRQNYWVPTDVFTNDINVGINSLIARHLLLSITWNAAEDVGRPKQKHERIPELKNAIINAGNANYLKVRQHKTTHGNIHDPFQAAGIEVKGGGT